MQILILTPDHRVLQALPGFWHPEDLARELRFSLVLYSLWKSKQPLKEKREKFRRLQLYALEQHPKETFARSRFQGFAQNTERKKATITPRDTFDKNGQLKKINRIVHERMAEMPFLTWTAFQQKLTHYSDLGERFYDLNERVDGEGKPFKYAARNAKKQAKVFAKQLAKAKDLERKKRKQLARKKKSTTKSKRRR